MINRPSFLVLAIATAGATIACRDTGDSMSGDTSGSPPPVSEMPGMPGMPAMQGAGSPSVAMMDAMEAHMRRTERAGGDSLRVMLPRHRQMVANLLAQMNREMREMNMPADAAWNATADSVRQDLRRMPEMSPAELVGIMPDHRARVQRMVDMHRRMMQAMGHR